MHKREHTCKQCWNKLLTMLGPLIHSLLLPSTKTALRAVFFFGGVNRNFGKQDFSSASDCALPGILGCFLMCSIAPKISVELHIKSPPPSIVTNNFCFSISVYLSLSLFLRGVGANSSNVSSGDSSGGNEVANNTSLILVDPSMT